MLLKCPSCAGNLAVRRLECPSCAMSIEAAFELPPILRLGQAQLDFVEVFIKNRGVIRDVERELGVSYPTVRAKLDEVVAALGFQARNAGDDEPAGHDELAGESASRRTVLDDLRQGRISPEDALRALRGKADAGGRSES
jgi:hypothetical protein